MAAVVGYDKDTIFDIVPTDKMFVGSYGRPLMISKVQQLARTFDPNAIGTIYLSLRRDGQFAILDGQHRIAASRLKGLVELPARVFIDLTYEQEAALYVKFATVNKQTSLDKFRARIEAKESLAVDIQDLLAQHNLFVSYGGQVDHGIQAIGTIEALYKKYGRAVIRDTINTIYSTWQGHERAYTGPILNGLTMFLQRYRESEQPKLDRRRLHDKLKQLTPESLLAKSSQLKGVLSQTESNATVGMVILYEYNHGLKLHRLPDWTNRVVK